MSILAKLALLAAVFLAGVAGSIKWHAGQVAIAERDAFSTELETTRRKVDENKAHAVRLLAKAITDNLDAEARLQALTTKLEADRAKSQTDLAAAVRVRSAERLSFDAPAAEACRRGGGGGGAEAQAAGPAEDPAATATVVLPGWLGQRLWTRAGEADSLSIDYRVLYDWANNPKLVCELLP